jgi:hypothetical protein
MGSSTKKLFEAMQVGEDGSPEGEQTAKRLDLLANLG